MRRVTRPVISSYYKSPEPSDRDAIDGRRAEGIVIVRHPGPLQEMIQEEQNEGSMTCPCLEHLQIPWWRSVR